MRHEGKKRDSHHPDRSLPDQRGELNSGGSVWAGSCLRGLLSKSPVQLTDTVWAQMAPRAFPSLSLSFPLELISATFETLK